MSDPGRGAGVGGDAHPGAQELAERLVGTMLERDAFSAWLGLEVTALGPGTCTVRMTVRDEMLNGFGV